MVADLRLLPSCARRALTLSVRLTFPIPKEPLSIEPFLGGKSLAETRGRTEVAVALLQYVADHEAKDPEGWPDFTLVVWRNVISSRSGNALGSKTLSTNSANIFFRY